MKDSECIFCNIIDKTMPAKVIYEDDMVMAFLDTDPVSEGHTLLVPKNHVRDILDIDVDNLERIIQITQKIAQKIDATLSPEGFNILQNSRKMPGKHVAHFHMHIIPRNQNDGIKMMYAEVPMGMDYFVKLDETWNKLKF